MSHFVKGRVHLENLRFLLDWSTKEPPLLWRQWTLTEVSFFILIFRVVKRPNKVQNRPKMDLNKLLDSTDSPPVNGPLH